MALAKDRNPNDSSHMSGLAHQSYTLYGNAVKEYEEGESPGKNGNLGGSCSNSSLSSPSSVTNSGGFVYRAATTSYHQRQPEEGHSVINFKPGYNYENGFIMQGGGTGSSCFLGFEENDEQTYSSLSPIQLMNSGSGSFDNLRLMENLNCIQSGRVKENHHHHEELESFGWPNPPVHSDNNTQHLATQESCFHKRAHSGESEQAFKKQCTSSSNATKKAKQKSIQSKDPQSIAAKNRRERISERLKVLQDLVPNGSKVDLVTMLEKAISYVKFLQLQVKVLATDEFWPVQGGKPPELSQVKEAIDAILSSSQKDRNSSSK